MWNRFVGHRYLRIVSLTSSGGELRGAESTTVGVFLTTPVFTGLRAC